MTTHPVQPRKKLIEVAIPLEAINAASAREKSIRHGHPSTLHLWWARRPLAAARAVIFCQMVDDPSAVPEEFPTEEAQENERLRLFALISELVQWENTTNEQVLNRAREEIRRSWRRCCADNADHPDSAELFNPEKLAGFHDPFAGGGALPLEAQRLGLEANASDLNPVAVLINKAMIEIPPKFAGMPPVNPESRRKKDISSWKGAQGLAEDVRYYGQWMRDEAEKRIGYLYPKVKITPEMVNDPENPRLDLKPYEGQELTVIAWLWARTVKSPNPAFSDVDVPLASTFMLSQMKGKESYLEPVVKTKSYSFRVKTGKPTDPEKVANGTSAGKRAGFRCILSGTPISYGYIQEQGERGELGQRLIGIVAEGTRGRVYLDPLPEMEAVAFSALPDWRPEAKLPDNPRNFNTPKYGLTTYGDLFTARQLVALTVFSELVVEASSVIYRDALASGISADDALLSLGGSGSCAYSEAVAVYLSLVADKLSDYNSTLCSWHIGGPSTGTKVRNTFGRQALPMTWDFAEVNLFSSQSGSFGNSLDYTTKSIVCTGSQAGFANQGDAQSQNLSEQRVVSTDPPYYDNEYG